MMRIAAWPADPPGWHGGRRMSDDGPAPYQRTGPSVSMRMYLPAYAAGAGNNYYFGAFQPMISPLSL